MRIHHGRVTLELHELARRDGPALLLLHSLGGSSTEWGERPAGWRGPVFALDFAGHGESDWVAGGAYHAELFLGDADAALAHIGYAAVAGAGIGAYVALLLAGARPANVPAALLMPGAGLDGGGPFPDYHREFPRLEPLVNASRSAGTPDPMARVLNADIRPVDFALEFAQAARHLVLCEDGGPRPPWWEAARRSASAETFDGNGPRALERLRAYSV